MARILLVEDNRDVRETILISLELAGFEVDQAPDGKVAINLLAGRSYDLLITDLWMPHIDGIELLKHLRNTYPGLPVIAISGGAPERASIEFSVALATTWGADIVLHKPFDNLILVNAAIELIATRAKSVHSIVQGRDPIS